MTAPCTSDLDIGFAFLGYLQIVFLGIVQGITELLPISSTAHMRVIPAVLGWAAPGSAFSAAMQLAALAAVLSYFWRDVRKVVTGSSAAIRRRDFQDSSFRLTVGIAVVMIPIGIVGNCIGGTEGVLGTVPSPYYDCCLVAFAVRSAGCQSFGVRGNLEPHEISGEIFHLAICHLLCCIWRFSDCRCQYRLVNLRVCDLQNMRCSGTSVELTA